MKIKFPGRPSRSNRQTRSKRPSWSNRPSRSSRTTRSAIPSRSNRQTRSSRHTRSAIHARSAIPALSFIPVLYVIPSLLIIWAVYLNFWSGPFYLRSIDPEYIYLINGLNCATLDFNKIGHFDNPGTFLQLLTGLYFRIIHLFTGRDDIFTDVITHPDLYLTASGIMMAVVTSMLILWLGLLVYRHTKDIAGALILQATPLFNVVTLGIYTRYNPERLMVAILVLFFILYIKYLYDNRFDASRFAIWSGIVMGAGLATKFNFLPVLVLPLFLLPQWRYRRNYVLALTGSAFIFILPVSSKFRALLRTVREWALHSGLYGTGNREILDTASFLAHIMEIFRKNISFSIILFLALAALMILAFRKEWRRGSKQEYRFLTGALVTILLGLVLVAKHYKGYYALPFLTLTSMILYTVYRFSGKFGLKYHRLASVFLFILLIFIPVARVVRIFSGPNEELRNQMVTESFIRRNMQPVAYWIVTPIWMSAPVPGSALALGVSYLHHRHLSYLGLERIFQNILTWEGAGLPLMHMRSRDANLSEPLLSGKGIYIYSRPGWNAGEVCGYVEQYARDKGIPLRRDTIYTSRKTSEHIIRLQNDNGWKIVRDLNCGFEKYDGEQFFTDDGQFPLHGGGEIHEKISANGICSIRLDTTLPVSPHYMIGGITAGDVIASSVKSSLPDPAETAQVRIRVAYTDSSGSQVHLISDPPPGKIHEKWYMSDLFVRIEGQPREGTVSCYVEYSGEEIIGIDDFSVRVYSREKSSP